MAAMSDYLENALIDCIFNGIAFIPPPIYIALLTTEAADDDTGTTISSGGGTGVEVDSSGTGYARLQVSGWEPALSGTTTNSGILIFEEATLDWGTVVGVAICDALTDGNILFHGALSTPKPVLLGDILEFDISALSISLN
jgi:hypothetical protein